MNRRQLILLLIMLVVIGGAGLVLLHQHRDSWAVHEARMGDAALPGFQPNAVAAIHIRGEAELDVLRTNGAWRVAQRGNYPANFGQISDFLIKLQGLKVVEAEPVGPEDLGRVNLEPPGNGAGSGVLIEFKDAQGKLLASLLAGKKHIRPASETSFKGSQADGRYILLPRQPQEVLLVSNTLAIVEPRPAAWLNPDFIKVEKIKSIAVAAVDPANSWSVSRESEAAPWTLLAARPGETLDPQKISFAVNAVALPRFTDVLSTNSPVETGFSQPTVVTIATFDQFLYTLKFGGKAAEDAYYMMVKVGGPEKLEAGKIAGDNRKLPDKLKQEQALAGWIYVVNAWIFDPLLVHRPQILQGGDAKSAETKVAEPAPKSGALDSGAPGWTPSVIK